VSAPAKPAATLAAAKPAAVALVSTAASPATTAAKPAASTRAPATTGTPPQAVPAKPVELPAYANLDACKTAVEGLFATITEDMSDPGKRKIIDLVNLETTIKNAKAYLLRDEVLPSGHSTKYQNKWGRVQGLLDFHLEPLLNELKNERNTNTDSKHNKK
jgi:hypothetical protein